MHASIGGIEFYLPENVVQNEELAALAPGWTADKIQSKTGISERHIAQSHECSSDLACIAAEKLFASGVCKRDDIDFLLFCTQSPDYLLPTTACLLQDRLGLQTNIGALDFNLGCSGYIYGLGLAQGLIETNQAASVLLLTADTYSKFLEPTDIGVRTLFGDGAAATLVRGIDRATPAIGPYVYGTDGAGAENLILKRHALRRPPEQHDASSSADPGGDDFLRMNGPEIFSFALNSVPRAVNQLLEQANIELDEIDLFVFHQANEYMLERLRSKLKIPKEKFVIAMQDCGNTVSSTIPVAMHRAASDGRLSSGMKIALVGFGVGYSWGATLVEWV